MTVTIFSNYKYKIKKKWKNAKNLAHHISHITHYDTSYLHVSIRYKNYRKS